MEPSGEPSSASDATDAAIDVEASDTDDREETLVVDIPLSRFAELMQSPRADPPAWHRRRLLRRQLHLGVEFEWCDDHITAPPASSNTHTENVMPVTIRSLRCNMCQDWIAYSSGYGVGAQHAADARIRCALLQIPPSGHSDGNNDDYIICHLCDRCQPRKITHQCLLDILHTSPGSYIIERHSLAHMSADGRVLTTAAAQVIKYENHHALNWPVAPTAAAYDRFVTAHLRRTRPPSHPPTPIGIPPPAKPPDAAAAEATLAAQPASEAQEKRAPRLATARPAERGIAHSPRRPHQQPLDRWFTPSEGHCTSPAAPAKRRKPAASAGMDKP